MSGLDKCWQAFERLKTGTALKNELENRLITSSSVSEEAGLDRGYLKRSRQSHLVLIQAIDAFKADRTSSPKRSGEDAGELSKKLEDTVDELRAVKKMLHASLGREMSLANQLRSHEKQIAKLKGNDKKTNPN